jgi:hypothetical protein
MGCPFGGALITAWAVGTGDGMNVDDVVVRIGVTGVEGLDEVEELEELEELEGADKTEKLDGVGKAMA